jgi:hypothetical protein
VVRPRYGLEQFVGLLAEEPTQIQDRAVAGDEPQIADRFPQPPTVGTINHANVGEADT